MYLICWVPADDRSLVGGSQNHGSASWDTRAWRSRIVNNSVGLIGVGLVGTALAERFMLGGYRVVGFDLDRARLEALDRSGGCAAASARGVASAADRIVLSLPTSEITAQVVEEIEPVLENGTILIDTTTGEPEHAAGLGARLANSGVFYLDATVGGSSEQVRTGEVIVMCGGNAQAFRACQDLFATFARRAFHMGIWGAGARMKLVLNLVLGLNRAVLAEGLCYAEACGINPEEALEVLRAGPAYSRVMDVKGQKMIASDFTPQARLSQHLKDVRLIRSTGLRNGAFLPLSALHQQLLEEVEAAGFGNADNSAIITSFQRPVREKR